MLSITSPIFLFRERTLFNEQEQLQIVAISGIQEDENNTIIMTTIPHPTAKPLQEAVVLPHLSMKKQYRSLENDGPMDKRGN